jgi:hypothetical protein
MVLLNFHFQQQIKKYLQNNFCGLWHDPRKNEILRNLIRNSVQIIERQALVMIKIEEEIYGSVKMKLEIKTEVLVMILKQVILDLVIPEIQCVVLRIQKMVQV